MGVSKNRGKTPKMDGENNGKPYCLMDGLGAKPTIFGNTHIRIPPNLKDHPRTCQWLITMISLEVP